MAWSERLINPAENSVRQDYTILQLRPVDEKCGEDTVRRFGNPNAFINGEKSYRRAQT